MYFDFCIWSFFSVLNFLKLNLEELDMFLKNSFNTNSFFFRTILFATNTKRICSAFYLDINSSFLNFFWAQIYENKHIGISYTSASATI